MQTRWILGWLTAVLFCAVVSSNAFAASDLVEKIQSALYAGQTTQAISVAQARLEQAPGDNQARFALGSVQFLKAVEHLGQSLYRYGLKSSYRTTFLGLTSLPILRLQIPKNPHPDKITYDAFRGILDRFARDLQAAESTLGKIDGDEVDLPLNIGLIRLDLRNDGKASDDETLWRIFKVVANANWLGENEAKGLFINFDRSDVPWLQAYCHLLMGIAEFPLAYDWRNDFETTFHNLFPEADLPYSAGFKQEQELVAELEKKLVPPWELENRLAMSSIADLIAFIHLNHWPVIEPQRLRDVLDHLEAMVRLSHDSWKRILAETDNYNEWIPNPKQTSVLPNMGVTQSRVEGWMLFLDEFEAVLEGKKLIPHWRFDKGINMRRFFLEPKTFDLVLLIQGSAALPYLQDGDLVTAQTWNQIETLFEGNFFQYFIWFN